MWKPTGPAGAKPGAGDGAVKDSARLRASMISRLSRSNFCFSRSHCWSRAQSCSGRWCWLMLCMDHRMAKKREIDAGRGRCVESTPAWLGFDQLLGWTEWWTVCLLRQAVRQAGQGAAEMCQKQEEEEGLAA